MSSASEIGLFLGQLLRRPQQISALAPSSRVLAEEMVSTLDPAGGLVIELGAGTGRITQAILDHGIAPEKLHSIEMNPTFYDKLRADFPGITVHQMSAADVGDLPLDNVQAVVSGLPLLSMSHALQDAILTGSFQQLGPFGTYIQFTYGPKPPIRAEIRARLDLTWTTSRKIWGNLPPARVYRFARPGA